MPQALREEAWLVKFRLGRMVFCSEGPMTRQRAWMLKYSVDVELGIDSVVGYLNDQGGWTPTKGDLETFNAV